MTAVYDAGLLIAAEHNDRVVWADHRARLQAGQVPLTTAPVVAQVSRSPRQVQLRRFLRGCDIVAFTSVEAHEVGRLLARAGTGDVVAAHVANVASAHGYTVLTSDPADLGRLSQHVSPVVEVRAV